jgi:hypothetical protein
MRYTGPCACSKETRSVRGNKPHKTRETQNASHVLHAPKAPRGDEQLHRNAVFTAVGTTATHNPECACTHPGSNEIDRTDGRTCVRLSAWPWSGDGVHQLGVETHINLLVGQAALGLNSCQAFVV